jgi:hypothetical protein
MAELVANPRRRLIITGALFCACVLLALACANFFPDRTWYVLNTLWPETVSRLWPVPSGADRTTEEDNIYEAVFQYMIESNNLRGHIYLSREGKDPSDKFMARFSNQNLDVKRFSEAEQYPSRGSVDPSTGERGVMLSVLSVKWFYWDRVQVTGVSTTVVSAGAAASTKL